MLNMKRRTTQGLMPDFPLLNVFGFGCYTFSTAVFLFSQSIHDQYAARHPRSPEPTNRINDLAFGALGFTMSIVTYSQFWPRLWGWEQIPGVQRHASKVTLGLISGSVSALAIATLIVSVKGHPADGRGWAWIDVVSVHDPCPKSRTMNCSPRRLCSNQDDARSSTNSCCTTKRAILTACRSIARSTSSL